MDVALRIYPRSFQDANGDGTGDPCHILPPMLEGSDPFAETSSLQKLRSNSSHRLCIIMCYLECLQRGLMEGLIWLSMVSKKNWNNQRNTYWPGSATTHQCGVHYPQVTNHCCSFLPGKRSSRESNMLIGYNHSLFDMDCFKPITTRKGLIIVPFNSAQAVFGTTRQGPEGHWTEVAISQGVHSGKGTVCDAPGMTNFWNAPEILTWKAGKLQLQLLIYDAFLVSSSQNLGQNAEWILKATGTVHCLTDADSVRHVDLVWPCHPAPWATTSDSFGQQFEDENDFILIPEWSDLDLFGLQVFNLEELGVGFVWVSPIMKSPMRDFGPGTRGAHGFYMFLSGGRRKNDAIPAILKSYTEMEATINNHSCHHLQRWHGDVPCEDFLFCCGYGLRLLCSSFGLVVDFKVGSPCHNPI